MEMHFFIDLVREQTQLLRISRPLLRLKLGNARLEMTKF